MGSWVALDWGTTNFRAYLMNNDDVVDHISTQEGMKFVDQQNFEKTLIKNITNWHQEFNLNAVIASGMVGAKQGWIEVPYVQCPCDIRKLNFKTLDILGDVKVHILSGISQFEPADVMRGEETQIAGFLLNNIDFKGSICLPGTHSKWVNLNSHKIKKFSTFLTGELYEIVKNFSILKHSVNTNELEPEIIKSAADLIIENPSLISNKLFEIRAENLLNNSNQTLNNSKLVGYLLGIELSGSRNYWEDKDLVIIGSSNLNNYYDLILKERSNTITLYNSNDMVLQGLSSFKKSLNL
jgi:2-dehydro-3-deoxygalactonokinase